MISNVEWPPKHILAYKSDLQIEKGGKGRGRKKERNQIYRQNLLVVCTPIVWIRCSPNGRSIVSICRLRILCTRRWWVCGCICLQCDLIVSLCWFIRLIWVLVCLQCTLIDIGRWYLDWYRCWWWRGRCCDKRICIVSINWANCVSIICVATNSVAINGVNFIDCFVDNWVDTFRFECVCILCDNIVGWCIHGWSSNAQSWITRWWCHSKAWACWLPNFIWCWTDHIATIEANMKNDTQKKNTQKLANAIEAKRYYWI